MTPLEVAASQVGVRETGRNRGPEIDGYLRSIGLEPGQPWCAAFVAWCLMRSGVARDRLPASAGAVRAWVRWAEATDRIEAKPGRGWLFWWLNADGWGHIGFVAGGIPGLFRTIEGNTDDAGTREGDGVRRRYRTTRSMGARHRHGYISLRGLR